MQHLVYDFGMNNGDDVEYYLAKGYRVVGVEANPALCDLCMKRFPDAINAGRLIVECAAVSAIDDGGDVPFFVHKKQNALSQMALPDLDRRDQFESIMVRQRSAASIVRSHGDPFYIKIDMEGSDEIALQSLFQADIKPDFISAETQKIIIFAYLLTAGYTTFNLVDGRKLSKNYQNTKINTLQGIRPFSFSNDSSGPCVDDIKSEWLDAESFFYRLATERLDAWKDIHASRVYDGHTAAHEVTRIALRQHLRDIIPSLKRSAASRLTLK